MTDLVTFENYQAIKAQLAFHQSPAKFKLYGGAMGGGKSYALCWEAIKLSLLFPGNQGLISRFRGKDLRKTTMPILLQMIPQDIMKSYNKTEGHIVFKNGSEIYASDLEDPNKLKSLNLGFFVIDEATDCKTDEAFNMLVTRLRRNIKGIRYFGLLGTNPEPGWVKDRFITNPQNGFKYFQALPRDNPHLPSSYESDIRSALAARPSLIKRYLEASWDAFDDMIFDPTWIIPGMPLSDRLYVSIFVDPAVSEKQTADETAISVVAFDEFTGIYHEIEKIAGRWSFDEIKKQIHSSFNRHKPNLLTIENVQAQEWLVQDLKADGLPAVGFKPDRDKVRKALAVQDMFQNNLVRVNERETMRQMIEFPNGTHDDRMDALISNLFVLKKMNLIKKDHTKTPEFSFNPITPELIIKNKQYDINKTFKSVLW